MKLYIETSVPNMLFVSDAPEKRNITETLFVQILAKVHKAFVSTLYLEEIRRTPSPMLRYQLGGVLEVYAIEVLDVTAEAQKLVLEYLNAGAFTTNNQTDALHVAVAVISGCEAVVSWNFRHIVRAWTMKKVTEINHRLGLPEIVICTPEEVSGDE